jgi:p-aminobenzoyl-glutamate transporter AbgT
VPLIFAVLIAIPSLAFALIGLIWGRYSLRAKRDHKPYLAMARGVAAVLSFGVAAFLMSIEIRMLEL